MNKGVVRCLRQNPTGGSKCDKAEWVLGQDLRIDPSRIQDFCAKPLTPIEQDLVLLTAVVAYTDRRFRRRRGSGWMRRFDITVPVSSPDLWRRPRIDGAVRAALQYVTGDLWDFEYVSGFEPIASGQSSLDFSNQNATVLPFSQGPDSYLTWHILALGGVSGGTLRVHSKSVASNSRGLCHDQKSCFSSEAALSVPIRLSVGTHPERSYRTGNFMFYVIAALAAVKLGVSDIVIGENGVSSLGPMLLPIGDEHPYRGTFPGFTRMVAQFINQPLSANIKFTHPNLFHTKGQMLQAVSPMLCDGWRNTNSCIRDSRSKLGALHCGVCGGCLLRRTTLHTVGWQDSEYAWTSLDEGRLDQCQTSRLLRKSTPNDEDIAMHAVYSMESFAQLAEGGCTDDLSVRSVALELTGAGLHDFEACLGSIADLCRAHRAEWSQFKAQFPTRSLIRRYEVHPCIN